MRVEIYRNLHKNCFSVRALEGPDKGRVVAHVQRALLEDATFVSQPAGREKVRREGKKNVHAFVRGNVVKLDGDDIYSIRNVTSAEKVSYNPYVNDSFVVGVKPIFSADYADLGMDYGVYAWSVGNKAAQGSVTSPDNTGSKEEH